MTGEGVGTMSAAPPILVARGLDKRFGPVHANRAVDLEVRVGEVLGLVGENGAGKSTLLSMLSGTLHPDAGSLELNGKPVRFATYLQSALSGVFRVYQHQALVPNLSVAENIYLSQERRFATLGVLNRREMERRARELFEELGVELRPEATLSRLDFAERQVVEIVRCLAQARLLGIEHPVILLDEPTSALTRGQIDFFFNFVRRIKDQAAQVFVSHRLEEIVSLCDRLVVLKDGEKVAENDRPRELGESEIHSMMVGRSIAMHHRERTEPEPGAQPVLELRDFSSSSFSGVTLTVAPGEIIGVAGVVGSGKGHLGRAIFELGADCSGEILVEGRPPERTGPRAGIRRSVGYVPTERHREGLVLGMTVAQNHSMPYVGAAVARSPVIDGKKERRDALAAIEQLSIKTPGPGTLIRNLSGGNQQKVILARWLTMGSKLLVLDNPTNGVDVGAKGEIYAILEQITAGGVSVILISDDLPELINMSDRILVMKDGRVRAEHRVDPGAPPSEVDLVAEMV